MTESASAIKFFLIYSASQLRNLIASLKISFIWRNEILGQYKRHGRSFTVSRIIKKLEPLLVKAIPLPKERLLSQEAVMCLVDATEQSIERPNKGQYAIHVLESQTHLFTTLSYIKKAPSLISIHKSSLIRGISSYKLGMITRKQDSDL